MASYDADVACSLRVTIIQARGRHGVLVSMLRDRLQYSRHFKDNTTAVVYFGSARSAPQSQGFIVYAFRDSVIITTGHNDLRVSNRVDVSTRD